jgi:hypothetical protein
MTRRLLILKCSARKRGRGEADLGGEGQCPDTGRLPKLRELWCRIARKRSRLVASKIGWALNGGDDPAISMRCQ